MIITGLYQFLKFPFALHYKRSYPLTHCLPEREFESFYIIDLLPGKIVKFANEINFENFLYDKITFFWQH